MTENQPPLTSPFRIGDVEVANRVLLAPLAGIGNWFVRLQARRHGAGLAVSEMVSSFGLHYRNERTLSELLRIHPGEHPVSIQLFGHDPEVMRSAAATCAEAGADLIDINMGCPVRKVCKTGAGASLLADPELALGIARGAIEGGGVPVTVKLRSGLEPGDRSGFDLAQRLVEEAGAAGIGFHPRPAAVQHRGEPDYALARELVDAVDAPVIISGGLDTAAGARRAYEESGADAVMIARGSLGNPWIFEELTGASPGAPSPERIVDELLWVVDRAEEHLGPERAARYLRKFYPWYLERLHASGEVAAELQRNDDLAAARALIGGLARTPRGGVSAELTDRVRRWRERGEETGFDGHRIHLFSRGGEGPTLLLLHGFPSCSYDWRLLIELLPGRAVIAPDYLGYGFSEKPRDHDYTLIASADLAEEVVRRQAPEVPVFVVGHDVGTSVANELMARDLEGALTFELAGVLLLNGSMVQDAASPTLGQRLLRGRLGPLVSRLSSERFFRNQFGSIFSTEHPLTDQEAADQWSLISHEDGQRISHRLIRYMDERMERAERWHGAITDWPGALSIGWGMVDPVATPEVLAAVRALRPAAPVTRWDDLGHYPQLEDPPRVAAALQSALDASL